METCLVEVDEAAKHGSSLSEVAEIVYKTHLEKTKEDQQKEMERKKQAILFRMKQLDEEEALVRSKYEHMVAVREKIRRKYPDNVMLHVIRLNLNQNEMEDEKKWVSKKLIKASELSKKKRIKMWKRVNSLDCIVTAKREQETPLINEEFLKCSIEEQVIHEYMQQQEIELSLLRHTGDLLEKKRLARMLDNKAILENKIARKREVEHDRLRMKEEVLKSQKQEREITRKLLYYIKSEEEKLQKLNEACTHEATENDMQTKCTPPSPSPSPSPSPPSPPSPPPPPPPPQWWGKRFPPSKLILV